MSKRWNIQYCTCSGLNLFEYYLSIWLKWFSWLCLLFSAATLIFQDYFYPGPIIGGAFTTSLFFCFVLLGLAGAGIRQNKAVLDGALLLSGLTGIGMIVGGIWTGILLVLLVLSTAVLRLLCLAGEVQSAVLLATGIR